MGASEMYCGRQGPTNHDTCYLGIGHEGAHRNVRGETWGDQAPRYPQPDLDASSLVRDIHAARENERPHSPDVNERGMAEFAPLVCPTCGVSIGGNPYDPCHRCSDVTERVHETITLDRDTTLTDEQARALNEGRLSIHTNGYRLQVNGHLDVGRLRPPYIVTARTQKVWSTADIRAEAERQKRETNLGLCDCEGLDSFLYDLEKHEPTKRNPESRPVVRDIPVQDAHVTPGGPRSNARARTDALMECRCSACTDESSPNVCVRLRAQNETPSAGTARAHTDALYERVRSYYEVPLTASVRELRVSIDAERAESDAQRRAQREVHVELVTSLEAERDALKKRVAELEAELQKSYDSYQLLGEGHKAWSDACNARTDAITEVVKAKDAADASGVKYTMSPRTEAAIEKLRPFARKR